MSRKIKRGLRNNTAKDIITAVQNAAQKPPKMKNEFQINNTEE